MWYLEPRAEQVGSLLQRSGSVNEEKTLCKKAKSTKLGELHKVIGLVVGEIKSVTVALHGFICWSETCLFSYVGKWKTNITE